MHKKKRFISVTLGDHAKGAVKGIMIGTLLAASLVGFSSGAFAAQTHDVKVKVNGYMIQMQEAPAYVDAKTNLTYVPLRFVSEALGAEIEWVNAKTPIKATIDKPVHNEVKVTLNSKKVEVNGKVSDYPGAAVLQSGRTMVPLRVISEGLGAEVKWNPEKGGGGTVEINTPWETPKPGDTPTTPTVPTKPVEPTKPTDTVKWNPEPEQRQYGQQVFKLIRFDTKNSTLKVSIPSMKGKDVTAGLSMTGKEDQGLKLDTLYEFKDAKGIKLVIDISGENDKGYDVTFDHYTIYSKDKLPPYADVSKIADNGDLYVFDQYGQTVPLSSVLKALGLE